MTYALIIEDNHEMADYIARMLMYFGIESQKTFGPLREDLELSKTPDVIFLDIHMPGMDGFEFLDHIRGHPELEKIPVVIITSDDQPETAKKAKDTGALALIIKPVTMEILEVQLKTLGLI